MAAKKGTQKSTTKQTTKAPAKQQTQKANKQSIDVRIDRLIDRDDTSIKAIASINIGPFAVHGFKIMDSQKGLFVAMPSNSYTDGHGDTQYSDIFHPTTKESREDLINKLKTAYEQALEEQQSAEQSETEEEAEGLEEEPPQIGPTM